MSGATDSPDAQPPDRFKPIADILFAALDAAAVEPAASAAIDSATSPAADPTSEPSAQPAAANDEGAGAQQAAPRGDVVAFPKRRGKRGAPAPDSVSAGDVGPRDGGYDVDALNREFALVLLGSKSVVFMTRPSAPVDDQQRLLTIEAFRAWLANRFTEVRDASGKVKTTTWAAAWLASRDGRSYFGVEFFPDSDPTTGTPGYLNLWSGFAVEPRAKKNGWKTFRDHLLNNVASGDEKIFAWVVGFFAHIVQRPRERLGVALILRGRQGAGKTIVGELIGALFPRHYFLVDDPRYVTGQFNAHLASCLLLQADEAVWAGDKAAEGRLKGLITSPIQQIEAKGVDPIRLANYVRLMMTSNAGWVAPAGKGERRFATLDVDPRCAQNSEYFAEMRAEMADGGAEALLYDLLHFDLATVDLRAIPQTAALLDQQEENLNSMESWLLGRLDAGQTTRKSGDWRQLVPTRTLFDDYIATAEKLGVHRRRDETAFGKDLRKIIPDISRIRRLAEVHDESAGLVERRTWCYALPPLAACRAAWDQFIGQPRIWPEEEERDSPGEREESADF